MDDSYIPSRRIAIRALTKLILTADDLFFGKSVQVTKLMPLFRLCRFRKNFSRFAEYLVKKDYAAVRFTRHSPVTDFDHKLNLLLETLNILQHETRLAAVANPLFEHIYDLQPGSKRINIHNSFRKASDRELLVAESSLFPLINEKKYFVDFGWSAYYLASTYVSTLDVRHNSYRTILKPESASRILDIAEYWSGELLNTRLADLCTIVHVEAQKHPD